jgi:hypothetical protein
MVGSWPCKVSSKIHINGWRVSEPVCEDKGKTMATETKDEKDMNRAHVVLSKGYEVVGLGYSRLTGAAVKVMDRGENLANPARLTGLARWRSTTRVGSAGLAKIAARSREQEGPVRLVTRRAGL